MLGECSLTGQKLLQLVTPRFHPSVWIGNLGPKIIVRYLRHTCTRGHASIGWWSHCGGVFDAMVCGLRTHGDTQENRNECDRNRADWHGHLLDRASTQTPPAIRRENAIRMRS